MCVPGSRDSSGHSSRSIRPGLRVAAGHACVRRIGCIARASAIEALRVRRVGICVAAGLARAMDAIEVTFPGGKRVDARVGPHVVHTDQPIEVGGEGSAVGPFDLFLASIAACAGTSVLAFCQARPTRRRHLPSPEDRGRSRYQAADLHLPGADSPDFVSAEVSRSRRARRGWMQGQANHRVWSPNRRSARGGRRKPRERIVMW